MTREQAIKIVAEAYTSVQTGPQTSQTRADPTPEFERCTVLFGYSQSQRSQGVVVIAQAIACRSLQS